MIHTNNNETDCNYKKISSNIYIYYDVYKYVYILNLCSFQNKQLILQINVTRNWILQDDFDMSCGS